WDPEVLITAPLHYSSSPFERLSMTGRVAVYAGAGRPLEVREYPVPEPPPGGMLVRVRQANICGSELHFWRGHGPFGEGQPIVFGHEAVAEVAALGEGTTCDSLGRPL